MGYCYTRDGRLVCDRCGSSEKVTKARCPWGYCPPPAICEACRQVPEVKRKMGRAFHREMGCERKHLEFEEKERWRRKLIAEGSPVRCSATSVGGDRVHVLFAVDVGRERTVGWYMDAKTYHSIPLGMVATADDFRKHGALEPAPDTFDYGRRNKCVSLV